MLIGSGLDCVETIAVHDKIADQTLSTDEIFIVGFASEPLQILFVIVVEIARQPSIDV